MSIENCKIWKYPRIEDDRTAVQFSHLQNGQEFHVEGATLRVMHTPGHSTDHVVFQLLEENAIFSGDCILGEGTAVFEDLFDYINSLRAILQANPSVIYPGHGNVVHDPRERITFYLDHRQQREQRILQLIQAHPERMFTVDELVKDIYTQTPSNLLPAAGINVRQHLQKLLREDKIAYHRAENRWYNKL